MLAKEEVELEGERLGTERRQTEAPSEGMVSLVPGSVTASISLSAKSGEKSSI